MEQKGITRQETGIPARSIEEISASIRAHAMNMAMSYIAIGHDLIDAKAQLGRGQWLPWLASMGFAASTAENYMAMAREVQPGSTLAQLPYSKALALLSLPASEREHFAQEIGAEDKSAAEIKRLIKERDAAKQSADALQQENTRLNQELWEAANNPRVIERPVETCPMDYDLLKQKAVQYDADLQEATQAAIDAENRAADLEEKLAQLQEEAENGAYHKSDAETLIQAVNEFLSKVQLLPYRPEALAGRHGKECRLFVNSVASWCNQMSAALDQPGIAGNDAVVIR